MTSRSILAAGAVILGLHAGAGSAADVTPDQRSALEALVKSWYAAGGQLIAGGADAVRVAPAGDRFDVTAPMRFAGSVRGEVRVDAKALPREEGRWRFENIHLASPFSFVANVLVPGQDGEKSTTETVNYTVKVAEQDGSADYDPSFRTPVRSLSAVKNLSVDATGKDFAQQSTVDAAASEVAVTPRTPAADRLDAELKSELSGYRMLTRAGGGNDPAAAIGFEAARMTLVVGAHDVGREQLGNLAAASAAIGRQVDAAGGKPAPLPPPLRDAMISALRGLASDMSLVQDLERFKFSFQGMDFAFDRGRTGFGGSSSNGLVRATMEFGYDGLAVPDMGLGFEELVPRQVLLKPYVGNMAAEGFSRLLATSMSGKSPGPDDFAPLFAKGPVVAGVETLALNVAGTLFTAEGKYTMTSPRAGSGTARIVAENFDSLIQKLGAQPMAQQAVPAVVFVKGIGRNEGGKLVWDVNYVGGKLTVNGLDMTAMTGGAPKGPAPRR